MYEWLPPSVTASIRARDRALHLVEQVRAAKTTLQASGAHRLLRDILQTPGAKRPAGVRDRAPPPKRLARREPVLVRAAVLRVLLNRRTDDVPQPALETTITIAVKLPGEVYLRVAVPSTTTTYDALLRLIDGEYGVRGEKTLALGRLARVRWVADVAPLCGESERVLIYDDGDVAGVVARLVGGEGWCRMALG